MMTKLRGAVRSVTIWVNGLFLAAAPFADRIIVATMTAVRDYLPDLQAYLPEDMKLAVGVAVVVFNIWQRARTSLSLAEKGSK